MKNIILTIVAMLMMTTAFAENENTTEVSNLEAYDMNINMNKLSNALNLSEDQKEAVENIHYVFNTEMMYAAKYGSTDRDAIVKRAIDTDIKRMSYVLNDTQMHKYMEILKSTIRNRGIVK